MKVARRGRWSRLGCGVALVLIPVPFLSYLLYCNQPLPREPEPRPLPNPNGFVTALGALAKLSPSPDDSPLARRDFTEARTLRQKLAPEKGGLDELRRSLRQQWGTPHVQDLSQDFPYLNEFRDAARKFTAESRLALAEKRPAVAMDRALDAVELGSRVGQEGPLLHGLVALACAAIGVDQAERCVAGLSAEEAGRAGKRLGEILARYPTAAKALDEERRVALSTLRKVFRSELDTQLLAGGAQRSADRDTPPWYLYPKPWAYREMDRGFRAYIAQAQKPVTLRQPVKPTREIMSRLLLQPLERVLDSFDRIQMALRLLRMELALEEYRERHGQFPATMADLEPLITPADTLDLYSGQSLIYRRKGEGYLLYSVGQNLLDDQGVPGKRLPEAAGKRVRETGDLVAGKLNPQKAPPRAE